MKCDGFKQLMKWQVERMQSAIREDKWYLSEEAHKDVGSLKAEEHFTSTHLNRCAAHWRKEYCTTICPYHTDCELATKLLNKETEK